MDYLMTKLYRLLKMNMIIYYIIFAKFHEIFKNSFNQMICHYLLKFPFVRNFPNKIIVVFSLIVLGTVISKQAKY